MRGVELFTLLEHFPIATVASVIVMILVAMFFVSGAASIVMGSLSQRGTIRPTRGTLIFWGVAPRARLPR